MLFTDYKLLDLAQWQQLLSESPVASWFQSPEAYAFFCSLPELMEPFIVAVIRSESSPQALQTKQTSQTLQTSQTSQTSPRLADRESVANKETSQTSQTLKGLIVGYVTKEHNPVKQFFTRRAIIYGGPLLAEDITDDELTELLMAVTGNPSPIYRPVDKSRWSYSTSKSDLSDGCGTIARLPSPVTSNPSPVTSNPIFIETRNFNDYSRWRHVFEQCGFRYQPHLNFHVDCSSIDVMKKNMDRGRKRNINSSLKEGATFIDNPTTEQLKEYYKIQLELYRTKVKTPLFPFEFFMKLFSLSSSKFFLIEYNGHVVGGTACVILHNKAVYEWYGCGLDGIFKGVYPSSLSTYQGMLYACNNGIPLLDMMGAGTPDEKYGVRDFKSRFGGKEVEHGRFIHINNHLLYNIGKLGVRLLKKC